MGCPENFAGRDVESLDPTPNPEFTARRSHDDAIARDERRHRRGLALAHVTDLRLPQLFSRHGIDRYGVPVEQVVDDFAVCEHLASIDCVTARRIEGARTYVGPVLPLQQEA